MPRIKVLPHAQICPNGAEFEVEQDANLCESLLKNGIKIEGLEKPKTDISEGEEEEEY